MTIRLFRKHREDEGEENKMRHGKNLAAFVVLSLFLLFPLLARGEAIDPGFVDITRLDPTIRLDIRYATDNNFTGKAVYPCSRCLLRKEVAEKLVRVNKDLRERGFGLKVYDCYRPLAVQKKFWEIMPDERYVANPAKGSRHNRGSAVDVGLTDLQGRDMAMPSGYDDFSERAHRDNTNIPESERKNSLILEEAMKKEGFIPYPTEWWHFDDAGWEKFPYADQPLCE
jgi:D-alanyl-D-alanine dipeptidase